MNNTIDHTRKHTGGSQVPNFSDWKIMFLISVKIFRLHVSHPYVEENNKRNLII